MPWHVLELDTPVTTYARQQPRDILKKKEIKSQTDVVEVSRLGPTVVADWAAQLITYHIPWYQVPCIW